MQLLESSYLGLRSARLIFRSSDGLVSVTLHPMVHVGEMRFYREAFDDAFAHDVVLVEGVRSSVSRNLTRSYRWIDVDRLGLVEQPKVPQQEAVTARIVNADLSTAEFEREWRKVPVIYRTVLLVLAPAWGIYMRILASRELIAKNMSLEDLPSADDYIRWNPAMASVFAAVLHARDERLIETLRHELDISPAVRKRIAVIYGALHIRAVLRELTARQFTCAEARWHTIFPI